MFLCFYRFETVKKRHLQSCQYGDFDYFAHVLMTEWTSADSFHQELDVAFVDEVSRQLRIFCFMPV